MTEPVTATTSMFVTGPIASVVATWAVIDPSITSITLAIIAALVVIIPLWFKFKTDAMNAKMKEQDVKIAEVIKTSDGMKDQLVKAASEAADAKGILTGIGLAENKAAIIAAAKTVDRVDNSPLIPNAPLLPTQSQPVALKDMEGVELTEDQLEKMISELQAKLKEKLTESGTTKV